MTNGFARPIGADQRHDLPPPKAEIDLLNEGFAMVAHRHLFCLKIIRVHLSLPTYMALLCRRTII